MMNINGQDMKTYQLFVVSIGNEKITDKQEFHPRAPVLKYHQESLIVIAQVLYHHLFTLLVKTRLQPPFRIALKNHSHFSQIDSGI